MPETAAEVDLKTWEERSDGLLFFDTAGNFTSSSAKLKALAGSEEAIRLALRDQTWPADFAASTRVIWTARGLLPLDPRQAVPIHAQCVRTSAGFIAAVLLQSETEQQSRRVSPRGNATAEVFSAYIRERRAISDHVHNSLTQDLVALSLSLSSHREQGDGALADAIAYVDRCCRGARALSYVLAPADFLDSDLIETIRWYGGVLRADAGVEFDFETEATIDPPAEIPAEMKELFFAGLQYIAAAAIWRPHQAAVRVRLGAGRSAVWIHARCSCAASEGLTESPLIRERARSLGGDARFVSGPHESSLEISVPCVRTWPRVCA